MRRLMVLTVIAAMITAGPAQARTGSSAVLAAPVPASSDPFLGTATYRLWTGRAPGATSDGADETPTVTVFRPQEGRANGAAVVVAPGGGYIGLAAILEGREVADWFTARGVTAFVLKYRVGPKARLPIPFADGARAIRFVRAYAATFNIDPAWIGMIGFSAGGHLAATTAASATAGRADAGDPIERIGSRPDFLVLGYPWLEGTALDAKGDSQYCDFSRHAFPASACEPRAYQQYAPTRLVTAAMPPTFIYHTTGDKLVPAEGSLRFYEALKARNVPVELHVFQEGEHGTGLGGSDPALTAWPILLENWLRGRGVFGPRK